MDVMKLADIERIVRGLLRQYGAEYAVLFGSYARGEAAADSDIDIIVFGGKRFDPKKIFEFAEDLRESTGKKVDAFEITEVDQNTPFFRNVLHDGLRIVA